MAQYKIPQDVEAEDKLIGPFSFRQFIYLIIAALAIATAIGLFQIFPGLVIIPLPVILLFLALALPLRKDQPMETYLVAVIRFFLKPRKRLWHPEGSISLVTIVAPKVPEVHLTKSIGGSAAATQLSYLSQVVDTQGWSTRGVTNPSTVVSDTVYQEAEQAEDVLDAATDVSRTFNNMIDKSNGQHRQNVIQKFQQAAQNIKKSTTNKTTTEPIVEPTETTVTDQSDNEQPAPTTVVSQDQTHVKYNPYPSSMQQHIVKPVKSDSLHETITPTRELPPSPVVSTPPTTSPNPVSPDIIRLANNNDLSISAIANEAHRIEDRDNEEVVIRLH